MVALFQWLREPDDYVLLLDAYFDESGKFKDHSVVSFCGVVGSAYQIEGFQNTWDALLRRNGLSSLTMKEALNHRIELSSRVVAKGAQARNAILRPFVDCIKDNFGLIVGFAVDVNAFGAMSEATIKQFGRNPHYAAFLRVVLHILAETKKDRAFNVFCDDEEETALPIYKLYRKIKLARPTAKDRLKSLGFGDDEFFTPLQAADMVASIVRLEARRRFFSETNEYDSLWQRLKRDSPKVGVHIGFGDTKTISSLSKSFDEFEQKNGPDAPLLVT